MRRLLLLALLVALPVAAQMTESIEVRITNIDVVVTGPDGKPVTGLTKDDFELKENGKKQEVTNFYEVTGGSSGSPSPAAAEQRLSSPAERERVEAPADRRRRVVIFIDDYSIHPHRRKEVFAAIDKALASIVRPGDEAMVVTWMRGTKVLTPFTVNLGEVRGALDRASKSTGGMGFESSRSLARNRISSLAADALRDPRHAAAYYGEALGVAGTYGEESTFIERGLIAAIEQMNAVLGGLDGKKIMVYAGANLPARPGHEMYEYVDEVFTGIVQVDHTSVIKAARNSQTIALENAGKAANAAGVTMYMINTADPNRGLMGDASEALSGAGGASGFIEFTNTAQSFESVAQITGGIALNGTKNFDLAMEAVTRDLNAYYSLGYRSPEGNNPQRRVAVRVKNHSDYTVRARETYVAKTPEQEMREKVLANVFQASVASDLAIGIETGKPVRASRDTYKVPVTVTIPSTLTLLPEGDELAGGFTFFVASGNALGAMSPVGSATQPVRIAAKDAPKLRARPITYTTEVLVRRGEHVMSVAVVDNVTHQIGFARARVVAH